MKKHPLALATLAAALAMPTAMAARAQGEGASLEEVVVTARKRSEDLQDVGVVVDGMFIGSNAGSLLRSIDIASMEVLRGPQGTLFGRNTIGGIINVTRTRPGGAPGVKIRAGYEEYDTYYVDGILNLLDEEGYTHGYDVAGLWSYAATRPPQTIGAELVYNLGG